VKLPMIEYASSLFDDIELKDCYIIGAQHILPSTFWMFNALFKKGLKKENLSLLGKSYSTDLETFHKMKKEEIDVCETSLEFNSHEEYDITYNKKIVQFLEKRKHIFKNSKYKKIIILDDGGKLLEALPNYISDFSNIVAMEQTSSGYNLLKEKKMNIPIINMARSKGKLAFETKRVIDNAIKKIFYQLTILKLKVSNVLILGNGDIGTALHCSLKDKYSTIIYDKIKERSDINHLELIRALKKTDLVIGCSGNTSLPKKLHKHLKKDVVLVSLSSSDREFDAVHFRKKTNKTTNPWETLKCDGIYLLNCGFPISFDNQNADDSYFFQYIRALIMSSIYQGIKGDFKNITGFIDLDLVLQEKMIKKFNKYRTDMLALI
jgi:S-adenosylhomocysteine hydrolase